MDKISSNAFLKAWADTVDSRKERMLSLWRQPKPFTAYVKGNEESIMQEVATRLDLLCYHRDYYSIDTVLYKAEDLVPGIPEGSFWFKDIRVAFEHENNFNNNLYQEIAHLLITDCDLRVLVTYPDGNIDSILDYLHRIISSNRKATTFSQEESILMIFGYEADFRWKGSVYKSEGWKNL
ncbi:MAG: hypothetical protein EOO61_00210 [Hymenobacter sp.]|nr:MAG: hypothetical protein EOO61_00210 [Hymenobacter sp.]